MFYFNKVIGIALAMWLIKFFVELCGLSASTWLARKLKKIEQTDMYDDHTSFSFI